MKVEELRALRTHKKKEKRKPSKNVVVRIRRQGNQQKKIVEREKGSKERREILTNKKKVSNHCIFLLKLIIFICLTSNNIEFLPPSGLATWSQWNGGMIFGLMRVLQNTWNLSLLMLHIQSCNL